MNKESQKTEANIRAEQQSLRFDREYVKLWHGMLEELEMYACENPKEQRWFLGYLCAYGPDEFGLDFAEFCETLADDIRKGRVTLNREQFREILKCERLIDKVNDLFYELEEEIPPNTTVEEICTRLVEHRLWKELSEQSRKTLQLLRKPLSS